MLTPGEISALAATAPSGCAGAFVRSGSDTMSSGATTLNVPITAVDLSRSVLFFNLKEQANEPGFALVRGQLTSATNIQFNRAFSGGSDVTIQWYVAELVSGTSVQRAQGVDLSVTPNYTITSVDLTKSFVLTSCESGLAAGSFGNDDYFRSRLTTATNLEITSTNNNGGELCDYQVVEYPNASVERGTGTLGPAATTSGSITISSVDLAKSFVLVTWQTYNSGTGGNFLRARLTSPTTIEIDRETVGGGNTVDYAWEVVEFTDATTVQSANASFSTLETSKTATLTSIDTSLAVAFLGADQRVASHAYTADDEVGPGFTTTAITDATTLTLERQMTGSVGAEAAWFVVEFASDSAPPVIAGQNYYYRPPVPHFPTTSSTWTAVSDCSLSFTPGSSSENWLVVATGQVRSSSIGDTDTGFVRLRVEGTVEGEAGVQNNPANGETGFYMMQRVTGTSAQQDIDVQAQDPFADGSTTTVEQCSITAFLIPSDADFQWTEVAGTSGNCPDTPDTTVLTHQFTPSSAGDYLTIVSFAVTERPGGDGVNAWITYPSGGVAPDFNAENAWHNDRYFLSSLVSLRKETLPASQQTLTLTCDGASAGSSILWSKAASFPNGCL